MALITKYKQNFHLFVRTIKLFILAWYIAWAARRGFDFPAKNTRSIIKIRIAMRICSTRRYFIPRENLTLTCKKHYPAGTAFNAIVAFAWLCEKMNINLKIKSFNRAIFQFFENDVLALTKEAERSDQNKMEFPFFQQHHFIPLMAWVGIFFISSEYGHKVLSKLSIKEDLKESANGWFDKRIKENWVAVHYRGTDVEVSKTRYKYRYRIGLESYIEYLQGVLDNQTSIFACSDQAQFIEKMKETFPGRVFARDINRSYDSLSLHCGKQNYAGEHRRKQKEDALIDILILAKADLIYTTGSGFVDVVRYFNPKIKIVSMDGRRIGRGKNNVPMPRKDLFEKLSIPL